VINKDDIEKEVYTALHELFEIDREDLGPDKHLMDDLDLDSIDAVDLIVRLQEVANIKVKPEQFKSIRTVQDIVDTVYKIVSDAV
jgi:acyl carrier protein